MGERGIDPLATAGAHPFSAHTPGRAGERATKKHFLSSEIDERTTQQQEATKQRAARNKTHLVSRFVLARVGCPRPLPWERKKKPSLLVP